MVGGRGAGAVTAVFCLWIRWTGEGLVGVQFGSVGTASQPPTGFAQVGRTKKGLIGSMSLQLLHFREIHYKNTSYKYVTSTFSYLHHICHSSHY
jgi:hypothetical protein